VAEVGEPLPFADGETRPVIREWQRAEHLSLVSHDQQRYAERLLKASDKPSRGPFGLTWSEIKPRGIAGENRQWRRDTRTGNVMFYDMTMTGEVFVGKRQPRVLFYEGLECPTGAGVPFSGVASTSMRTCFLNRSWLGNARRSAERAGPTDL
jgi:hypothetical protein